MDFEPRVIQHIVNDSGGNLDGWETWTEAVKDRTLVMSEAGNTPAPGSQFNGNNAIAGTNYDYAGNQTLVNGDTASYDAENREISVTENGATESYVTTAMGSECRNRSRPQHRGVVYDAFGNLEAEYSPAATHSKDYIRLNGQVAAIENAGSAPCATCYLS